MERWAPFLILLLSQCLLGFVPLFGIALSSPDPLPQASPFLLAVAVWSIPNLLALWRAAGSQARARRLYHAVITSVRSGYAVAALLLVVGVGARFFVPGLSWEMTCFATFLVSGVVTTGYLRRQLASLYVLDR